MYLDKTKIIWNVGASRMSFTLKIQLTLKFYDKYSYFFKGISKLEHSQVG